MASSVPIPVSELSDEAFERRTPAAIHRELGPGGVVRFLMEFRSGHGDDTAERHQWLSSVTIEEVAKELGVDAGK
jgi:hypothetical protein